MKRNWKTVLMLAALCAIPFGLNAQTSTMMTRACEVDDSCTGADAGAYLWTNKLGYEENEQMSVYITIDPVGVEMPHTLFFYRENIETGERTYYSPMGLNPTQGSETVVDALGLPQGLFQPFALNRAERTQTEIWTGDVPDAGLWHFVAEARTEDATQVVKRAYAKFVVSENPPVVMGEDGTYTEISTDTTWNNDTIYKIRNQVFVNDGATLTIEPGTLILAQGQNAVIVVEKGGKIMAEGRREAPIVMTCDDDVGTRTSGCWGGLIILGNADVTRDNPIAEGVVPETRPVYGGTDDEDSSGVLRYVRVEFAGVDFSQETQPNAFGFHGVGSGTVIEYIQAHEGEDDGIEFFGGTANCLYCVSDGAKDDGFDWALGWRGTAQNLFILQDGQSDNGIEADNDREGGFNATPRSHPTLYNVTMIGGAFLSPITHQGDGMRIRVGSAVTARNVIVAGFGGDALDVRPDGPTLTFFEDGTSSLTNSILTLNGGAMENNQINDDTSGVVVRALEPEGNRPAGYMDVDPMLRNITYEGNPDPRPVAGSPALRIGAAATPPSDGTLDPSAQCIGAFCSENWLEEWTFFGDEEDYDVP